ncbi:chaperone modulator CbpM [Acinetobacter higginsii]|uniref:chaperone modulator CbpM n=1 Tax=Acinetobacter higginsii TaxID=70347 RepID=UPI0026767134|nr:chaperone modulator CbpM [Acinetobacter higginsii]MDO3665795.1 chaperone modulator CbpM [Acinetobacter higginsii]
MTTIQYKEIQYDGHSQVEIIDEQLALDLEHFAEVCGQSTDWVLKLIDYDILQISVEPQSYQFIGEDVSRARRAYRLQRDFDASLSAVAVMLDLIDEVQQLRKQLKHFH